MRGFRVKGWTCLMTLRYSVTLGQTVTLRAAIFEFRF
jgi:hypothetical protein